MKAGVHHEGTETALKLPDPWTFRVQGIMNMENIFSVTRCLRGESCTFPAFVFPPKGAGGGGGRAIRKMTEQTQMSLTGIRTGRALNAARIGRGRGQGHGIRMNLSLVERRRGNGYSPEGAGYYVHGKFLLCASAPW